MKTNIKLPFSGKKYHHFFQPNHETTLNFGSFIPVYIHDLCPNEDLQVDSRLFARVAPMLVPTFGDVRIKLNSYFVPYSCVWDYWKDFIEGKISPNPNGSLGAFVQYDTVPRIYNSDFIRIFITSGAYATRSTQNSFDFCLPVISDNGVENRYYVFTKAGKRLLQILQCLGYNFRFDLGIRANESESDPNSIWYSALPLLCFCYLYYEHFVPQQYKVHEMWRNFAQKLHDQVPVNGVLPVNRGLLEEMLNHFVLSYKQDYFTSMWNQPNMLAPSLVDVDQYHATIPETSQRSDQPYNIDANQTDGTITVADDNGPTPWSLRLAAKLQGWITRNNLVGSDYINRILANFGVKPVERNGVVQYCGSYETQLRIDSIFDTAGASPSGAPLGSYAGRGMVSGSSPKFSVSVKEHGMFFVLCSVQPVATFTDGVDRNLLYESRFDFFTPDFDGLAMQGTPICEVFNTFYNGYAASDPTFNQGEQAAIKRFGFRNPRRIIGYSPRYAERKYAKCRVTGDFNVNTLHGNVAPYSLQRNVFVNKFIVSDGLTNGKNDEYTLGDIVHQTDISQFNRIFVDTTGYPDPIFALFDFKVKLISPMKQIGDSFDMDNEGNKSIGVEKNGAYSN